MIRFISSFISPRKPALLPVFSAIFARCPSALAMRPATSSVFSSMLTQWFRPEVNMPSNFVPWSCDMAEKPPARPVCVVDLPSSVMPAVSNISSFLARARSKMSEYRVRNVSASSFDRIPSLMNSANVSCHFFSSSE